MLPSVLFHCVKAVPVWPWPFREKKVSPDQHGDDESLKSTQNKEEGDLLLLPILPLTIEL